MKKYKHKTPLIETKFKNESENCIDLIKKTLT